MMFEGVSIIIWFVISTIFFVLELIQKENLFIYFSVASFLSLIASFLTENVEIQIVIFLMSSFIFVCFVKIIFDKMMEFNLKFTSKKYNNDKFCMILKEMNKELKLYKVICKSGIFTAKFIGDDCFLKFKICKIIHDDGNVLLVSKK